jgi:tRNA uridine 5-carbamoylmethylation protein Kti12
MGRVIYILVGPPCSGKTTEAKKMLADQTNLLRVNRDSYRYMLRNEGYCNYNVENIITGLQDRAIDKALEGGYDVIIDNTHCKPKYISDLTKKYADKAAICVYTFKASLLRLRFRNIVRYLKTGVWIPDHVLVSMQKGFKESVKFLDTHGTDYCKEC